MNGVWVANATGEPIVLPDNITETQVVVYGNVTTNVSSVVRIDASSLVIQGDLLVADSSTLVISQNGTLSVGGDLVLSSTSALVLKQKSSSDGPPPLNVSGCLDLNGASITVELPAEELTLGLNSIQIASFSGNSINNNPSHAEVITTSNCVRTMQAPVQALDSQLHVLLTLEEGSLECLFDAAFTVSPWMALTYLCFATLLAYCFGGNA